jgi:hypothetical protein
MLAFVPNVVALLEKRKGIIQLTLKNVFSEQNTMSSGDE